MFSSHRNVQYPFNHIFREYITKFMNQCIQSANERKSALLITNDTLINTETPDDSNSSPSSSKILRGLFFLSISTGIYLFISRKK